MAKPLVRFARARAERVPAASMLLSCCLLLNGASNEAEVEERE